VAKKQQTAKNVQERKTVATDATKHYDSQLFTLGFDYPANWVVSDKPGKLTVTSPTYSMATSDSAKGQGNVIVTIQNQQPSVPGYPSGGATAALDSTKLTYKKPSNVQRAETFMSYLDYSTQGGITALYLTGDNAYAAGDAVPITDLARASLLVNVTFQRCDKSYCTGGRVEQLTIASNSWAKAAYKDPVTKLLESLVIN